MCSANRSDAGEKMQVSGTGLFLLQKVPPGMAYLSASADGLVHYRSVDTNCVGSLEIKCPFSIAGEPTIHLTPEQIAAKYGKKFYLETDANGELHLQTSHHY